MSKTSTPARTEIEHGGDFAADVVPHYLEYPPEIEDATEAVRAGIARHAAARHAVHLAYRRHEPAEAADRLAAAQASAAGATVEPTEPSLRRELKAAQDAERAAFDALSIARRRQKRAITPQVARTWRAQHPAQIEAASDEIRKAVAELGDLIATRDLMIDLDKTLERVENGEPYRLDVASPGAEQRQLAKKTASLLKAARDGFRSITVPNETPYLLAALLVDAERWQIVQERKRQHERRAEITVEVRRLGLAAAQRDAEILRRLAAEEIPAPTGVIA